MRRPWLYGLLVLLLAGCGSDTGRSAVADACEQKTELGPAICACLGERAEAELTAPGRRFLVAMLQRDEELMSSLRTELSIDEATRVAMFMVRGPAACADETRDPA